MSSYSDHDVDAIVAAVLGLRARRHDVTAALAVALYEAGARFPSREDLFGQFDDVADNRYLIDLMSLGRRYTRANLAQFQVQAGLEFMGGSDTDIRMLQAELDLPNDAMRDAVAAEVSRGAARRVTERTYRSMADDADVSPEEWP